MHTEISFHKARDEITAKITGFIHIHGDRTPAGFLK